MVRLALQATAAGLCCDDAVDDTATVLEAVSGTATLQAQVLSPGPLDGCDSGSANQCLDTGFACSQRPATVAVSLKDVVLEDAASRTRVVVSDLVILGLDGQITVE